MVLMGMTKRSNQQIALGRRPTWICRIGRLCIAADRSGLAGANTP
jgi:hypothetical protein